MGFLVALAVGFLVALTVGFLVALAVGFLVALAVGFLVALAVEGFLWVLVAVGFLAEPPLDLEVAFFADVVEPVDFEAGFFALVAAVLDLLVGFLDLVAAVFGAVLDFDVDFVVVFLTGFFSVFSAKPISLEFSNSSSGRHQPLSSALIVGIAAS